MANTTNLSLVKLSGSEKLKTYPTNQAGNMDIIDAAFGAGFGVSNAPNVNASINNLADGLAIVANGNTHAAITSGQYVYVRNHGSLSEGLYTATANISANATLSGSNLTANSSGGLNSLNSNIQIPQRIISTDVAATISSYSSFNTVLSSPGLYFIQTNQSIRSTLISLGLYPIDLAGNYEVRKITSGYYFLDFKSYTNREWIATIDNGTISAWQELALNRDIATIAFGSSSNSLKTNLENDWTSYVPNNSLRLVIVTSQYGSYYGYLSRYANVYGSGVLTRYEGSAVIATLSEGNVTVYNITKTTT